MKLFGFSINREKEQNYPSPVAPTSDASMNLDASPGFLNPYMSVMDVSGNVKNENDMIDRYREIVHQVQEVGMAVDEIAQEAIITDDHSSPIVELNMEKLELQDNIKEMIVEEFNYLLGLMKFDSNGYEIFRNWYIDGRIYYHVIIDPEAPESGILELRYIDSKKIKKVREITRAAGDVAGLNSIANITEYFVYTENPNATANGVTMATAVQNAPVPMPKDSIAFANSGLLDPSRTMVISYLHDALRPANNLRMMEDALLIYRLTRAPERRVFYIDTGDLPKGAAEQYMQEQANKYKTKIVYDTTTGAIKNDKRYIAMTEDYWIPRMNGSTSTQIDTLEGGANVGETGDADFFLDRVYKSLKVPKSRFDDVPSMFSNGMEITRDEVRFSRFITRLRARFSMLFQDILGKQLILTGIMAPEEWEQYRGQVSFTFQSDNTFAETMKANLLMQRMSILAQVDPFIGKYFSRMWVYKNILELDDDEIKEIDADNENDPWLIAQQEAEAAAQGLKESIVESTDETDGVDDSYLTESEIELNGSLADYFKTVLKDVKA